MITGGWGARLNLAAGKWREYVHDGRNWHVPSRIAGSDGDPVDEQAAHLQDPINIVALGNCAEQLADAADAELLLRAAGSGPRPGPISNYRHGTKCAPYAMLAGRGVS